MARGVNAGTFGALLLAAVLGGVFSQVAVRVVGGAQVEAAEGATAAEVRATGLVIVDGDGVERARLGVVSEEGPLDGGAALLLHDAEGVRRFYVAAVELGGGVALMDPQGNTRLNFGHGPDGCGLQIAGADGDTRLSFGEGPTGGALQMSGPGNKRRFSVGYGPDAGGMQFCDSEGQERFHVSESGVDCGLQMFDADGNKRFEFFDGETGWSGITLIDLDGTERAGVKIGPGGEADFYITGGVTEWRASACMQ